MKKNRNFQQAQNDFCKMIELAESFGGTLETTEHGQIVIYTNLQYCNDDDVEEFHSKFPRK